MRSRSRLRHRHMLQTDGPVFVSGDGSILLSAMVRTSYDVTRRFRGSCVCCLTPGAVSISIVDDKNANEKSYGLFFKRLCA